MKKILAIFFAIVMAFTVAAFSASAAGDVAAIGEATFATLADAIVNAEAGDTITLLDDVTEDVTIKKNITLDGADNQYTGKITLNNVTATIQNVNFVNGQIYKHKNTGGALTITVKNCSFTGSYDGGYAINIGLANKLVIENCDATDVGFGFIYVPSSIADIVVKDVNIDGASYGIHIVYNGTSTFENVTIKNATYGIIDQTYGAKTFTFENCEVEAAYPVFIVERSATAQNFVFKGENDFGTADFTFGSSLVKATVDVAKLGDEVYSSLQAAIDACSEGDNYITLLVDCNETVTIKQQANINVVIDGNGKTYSGTIKVDGNKRPTGAETLTIKNVNFVNEAAKTYAYFINAEKSASGANSECHNLTVDSCTFKSTNWHYAVATRNPYNLTIKNCEAENVYYLLYNPQGGQKITVEDCDVTNATYGIGSQKCLETYIKNYTYTGMAAGIYGRSSINKSVLTMENIDITTTLAGQPAITLWKNNDGDPSNTFKFVFLGETNITAPEGVTWFAYQTAENSPYEITAKCNVDESGNTFAFIHTPGAASTCTVAQICTVCKIELDGIKEHEAGEYVSNNDATCTADGTKTAECIYGCGKTYTVTVEGSIKPHTAGAPATCMAPQTCTGCGIELDGIKEHQLGAYVSNNDATCTHDGTKTAECIYGCGLSDTITDVGTMGEHNDVDGSGNCDGCYKKCCEICGGFHKDMMADLICLLGELVRLIIVFFTTVF